jgi:hypothetical protein
MQLKLDKHSTTHTAALALLRDNIEEHRRQHRYLEGSNIQNIAPPTAPCETMYLLQVFNKNASQDRLMVDISGDEEESAGESKSFQCPHLGPCVDKKQIEYNTTSAVHTKLPCEYDG